MKNRKLSLDLKDKLRNIFSNIRCPLSEYNFSNLYLFRKIHKYTLIQDKNLFIKGLTYDGYKHLMPLFNIEQCKQNVLINCLTCADFIFPIQENWIKFFDKDIFDITYNEADSDYVYKISSLAEYKANKLHGQKNLLNQFILTYKNHYILKIEESLKKDVLYILDEWQEGSGLSPDATDFSACKEAIDKIRELELCSAVYYVGDEPAGFIIGEQLNDDFFTIHFLKARKKFKGIYQYIFNNFSNRLSVKYKYLNLQEDLGKPNLRRAKASYSPDFMLKKYRISLKNK